MGQSDENAHLSSISGFTLNAVEDLIHD